MKTSRWIICLVLFFTAFVGAQQSGNLQVAVYPFDGIGVDETTAMVITNSVYRVLIDSKKLEVRDQQSTRRALEQIGLAQSGHCTQDTCKVEAGKVIKAQKLIMGSVEKLDQNLYTISIRVVDVQTARTEYSVANDCQCSNNKQIRDMAMEFARQTILIYLETGKKPAPPTAIEVGDQGGTIQPPAAPTPPTPVPAAQAGEGTLEVRTNPSGARIFVDSEEVGVSNKSIQVAAGEHEVVLIKEGYEDVSVKVIVPKGRSVILTKNLVAQTGGIEVTVNVAGASIFLDGKLMGSSAAGKALKIDRVGVGDHKIKVAHPMYETTELTASVSLKQVTPVTVTLAGLPGKILITSSPQGATVTIDGAKKGATPLSVSLPAGSHSIALSLFGYEAASKSVDIAPGKNLTLPITLKKESQAAANRRKGQIAVGFTHTCAITPKGGVKCWGDNQWGQLGNGTNNGSSRPVDVPGLSSGVVSVGAGAGRTCVLTSAGGVKCWGNVYPNTPTDIEGLTSGVTAISVGYWHQCAITTSGGLKCWGDDNYGQLGDGVTKEDRYKSRSGVVDVLGLTSGVIGVTAGFGNTPNTCAIISGGALKCWGGDSYGKNGDGQNKIGEFRSRPVDVTGLSSGVVSVSISDANTCVILSSGGMKCWGLAYGPTPKDVEGFSSGVAAIVYPYVVMQSGAVKILDQYGGKVEDIPELSGSIVEIATHGYHACALMTSGEIKCWGRNENGELGNGTKVESKVPVTVVW